jgi:FkbM family methyltransferase
MKKSWKWPESISYEDEGHGIYSRLRYPMYLLGSRKFHDLCTSRDRLVQSEAHNLFQQHGLRVSNVLDLGANRGNFSIVASQYALNVVSIEPHPLAFSVLKKNARSNMTLLNAAVIVGSSPKWLDLMTIAHRDKFRTLYKSESSSCIEGKFDLSLQSAIQVRTCDLNSLVKQTFFDVIKMDVEGSELHLLPYLKANSSKFGKLFVEVHTSKFPQKDEFLALYDDLPTNIFLDWI